MSEACDAACLKIPKQDQALRELVAALVIECPQIGERDALRQYEFALSNFKPTPSARLT
jgi:hypothetical protein